MNPQNNLNLYYLSHTDRNSESVSDGLKLHIWVVAGPVGSLRHQAPSSFTGSCCVLDPSVHRLRMSTLMGHFALNSEALRRGCSQSWSAVWFRAPKLRHPGSAAIAQRSSPTQALAQQGCVRHHYLNFNQHRRLQSQCPRLWDAGLIFCFDCEDLEGIGKAVKLAVRKS